MYKFPWGQSSTTLPWSLCLEATKPNSPVLLLPVEKAGDNVKRRQRPQYITTLLHQTPELKVAEKKQLVAVTCRSPYNVCRRNAFFLLWNKGLTQQNSEKVLRFMNSRLWHYLKHTHTHTSDPSSHRLALTFTSTIIPMNTIFWGDLSHYLFPGCFKGHNNDVSVRKEHIKPD